MGLQDLVVTPLYFIAIVIVAYIYRNQFVRFEIRKYFMPALIIRMVSAILIGVLYQFYYNGGDTYNYHTDGSVIVAEAIQIYPVKGLQLLFSEGELIPGLYDFISRITFYRDSSSYMVVKIAAVFDLFTFSTYSATALFFALFSFIGQWQFFKFITTMTKANLTLLAGVTLFIPSVVFWGSGLLKDSLTLGSLCFLTVGIIEIFVEKKLGLFIVAKVFISFWILYVIKIYILLAFLPAILFYLFIQNINLIRPRSFRYIFGPVILIIGIYLSYIITVNVTAGDSRYAIDNLAATSRITAYDIAYWTGSAAGSTYTLGELDGTFEGMIKLAPQGIIVSLFRPFPWEVRNFLMFISSLESLLTLLFTLYVIYRLGIVGFLRAVQNPLVIFCLSFSLIFAFAVGVSTYNFGTLVRYKIPLLPFYSIALIAALATHQRKKEGSKLN